MYLNTLKITFTQFISTSLLNVKHFSCLQSLNGNYITITHNWFYKLNANIHLKKQSATPLQKLHHTQE